MDQTLKERQINLLKKSIKWWNYYRCISNLNYANLENACLNYARLENANLENSNLKNAYLQNANLENANLKNANLENANLKNANLKNVDLDYSCLPLRCSSLKAKFDQKHIIQFLYHACKPCEYHAEIIQDEDLKELLNSDLLAKVVNKFHRIKECGELQIKNKKERR